MYNLQDSCLAAAQSISVLMSTFSTMQCNNSIPVCYQSQERNDLQVALLTSLSDVALNSKGNI